MRHAATGDGARPEATGPKGIGSVLGADAQPESSEYNHPSRRRVEGWEERERVCVERFQARPDRQDDAPSTVCEAAWTILDMERACAHRGDPFAR